MELTENPIVSAIKYKFGWTIPIYAERRGLELHNLKRLIYGKTKGCQKGSRAEHIKKTLIKDGILREGR